MAAGSGEFVLTAATALLCVAGARREAELLSDFLRGRTGIRLTPVAVEIEALDDAASSDSVRLILDGDGNDRDESYALDVSSDRVDLRAKHGAGLAYAAQTLRQLVARKGEGSSATHVVPAVSIRDEPRFEWRGLHLDVGRHMFPVSFVKKYIDALALHKFNVFHWHLTEDQGWRIEIKKYPKLASISAWRDATPYPHDRTKLDGKRYGGYYTQEEVREVVAYAAERHVTVVPEIEMPGEFGNLQGR